MDLENINKDFSQNKSIQEKLKQLKTKMEQLNNEIEGYKLDKSQYEIDKQRAILNKDKTSETDAQKNIDNANKEIEKRKEQLAKMKEVIQKNNEKVEACIEKLSENPELKKHIDNVMRKKLVRRAQKTLKENETLKGLNELMGKHPSIQNNIVGMKNAQIEIGKLEDELGKLDPSKDTARINQIKADIITFNSKYDKNQQMIIDCAKKDNVDISKESLKQFVKDSSFKIDKSTKKWNVEATIKNKIKGNEKAIRNDEIVLSNLTGKEIKIGLEKEDDNGNVIPTKEADIQIETKTNLPAKKEQLKWYQFIKKFKNWRQNRKNQAEEPDIYYNKKDYENELEEEGTNEFKDSLKYDVVQEYAKRYEKELYKDAKKERKESGRGR